MADDLPVGSGWGAPPPPGTPAPAPLEQPPDQLPVGSGWGQPVPAPMPQTMDQSFWSPPPQGWGSYMAHRIGLGTRDVMTGLGLGPVANLVGLPTPQTTGEALQSAVQTGAAGTIPAMAFGYAAPLAEAAGPTTQAVASVLRQQPVRQALTGGAAGGAAGTAAWAGLPPWMQTGAAYATALLSGLVPGATSGLSTATDQALIDRARNTYSIPVYPGQTGSGITRYIYSTTGKFPTSGAAAAGADQQAAFNTAVGKTFGADTIDGKLTPAAMSAARAANSAPYEAIAGHTTVRFDPQLVSDLSDVVDNINAAGLPSDQANAVLQQIRNIRDVGLNNQAPGTIPPDWLTRTLGVKSPLSRGAANYSTVQPYFQDVRDALNSALERSASPDDLANLRQAQQNWKNMRTVEGLVARNNGDVPMGKSLSNAVAANRYQQAAYTGGGALGELGEISRRFLTPPPESGTLERGMATALTGAGALAVERALQGNLGQAASVIGTAALPYGAAAVINPYLRRGALGTQAPSMGDYYLRALLNPALGAPAEPTADALARSPP